MAEPGSFVHICCVIALIPMATVSCQTYDDTYRLITDLVTNSSSKVRPVNDQITAVAVNMSINIFQLTDVDVVRGLISMAAMTIMSWRDERITWSPEDYGNITSVFVTRDLVWRPNIACSSPFTNINEIGEQWMKVRYLASGYASYTPADIVHSSCAYDVSSWPFDRQICDISFMAFGYLDTEVRLHAPYDGVYFDHYIEHGEWQLTKSTARKQSYNGMGYVVFSLHLKRRYEFFFLNIILPVVGIMVLNPMVFLLPSESGERVGYSITVLLSIAVFFSVISNNLPTSSAPMAKIVIFNLVGLGCSMAISLAVILNLRLYHKPDTDTQLPAWATCIVRFTKGKWRSTDNVIHVHAQEGTDGDKTTIINRVSTPQKLTRPRRDKAKYNWKDASNSVDQILFVLFCAISVVLTVGFMSTLVTGDH